MIQINEFTRREKLWKLFQQEEFVHNIFTPYELCEEIISKVDVRNKDILVLNPEFALLLIEDFGVTPSRITIFADFDPQIETIAQRMDINYIDAWNYSMKFDVVFANPPYQHPTNRRWKFWVEFTQNAFNVCNEGGQVAIISPNSWINSSKHTPELFKALELWKSKKLTHIENVDPSVFNIGESVGYYIAINENCDSQAFLNTFQTIETSIVSKAAGNDYPFLNRNNSTNDRDDSGDLVCYHSNANRFNIQSISRDAAQRKPKVIINTSGYYVMEVFDENTIAGRNARALVFDTIEEAEVAKNTLSSKLFVFINNACKNGGFNILTALPKVDLSRKWTDEELYEFFGLTQEEIDYVENYDR